MTTPKKYSFPNLLMKDGCIRGATSYEMLTSQTGKLYACFYDAEGEAISEHLAYLNYSEKTKATYHTCFIEPSKNFLRSNPELLKNFTFDPQENMKLIAHCGDYNKESESIGKTKSGNEKYKVDYCAGYEVLTSSFAIKLENKHSAIHAIDYAYFKLNRDTISINP